MFLWCGLLRSWRSCIVFLEFSDHTMWGFPDSGGWITQVVSSGCGPPLDTTKWPGLDIKHLWHDMLEYYRKGETSLRGGRNPDCRGGSDTLVISHPPSISAGQTCRQHPICSSHMWLWSSILRRDVVTKIDSLTGLKSPLLRVYGRASPVWQL